MTEGEGFVDQSVVGLAEPQPMYKALCESTAVFQSPVAVVLSYVADIEMALKKAAAPMPRIIQTNRRVLLQH
jgi:hypothetical protein